MIRLTDDELREQAKKQLKKEREDKIEAERYMFLRYEVEMHEKWDLYNPNKEQRANLQEWYEKWGRDDLGYRPTYEKHPKFYLEKLDDFNIPSIKEQMNNSPDDYVPCQTSSIYGFETIENRKKRIRGYWRNWSITGLVVLSGIFALYYGCAV